MSKAVMISIRPKWCEKIVNGEKTIEVRKTRPKLETPFKCYIYETQGRTDTPWVDKDGHMIFAGRGQVIGEFVCDCVTPLYNVCTDDWKRLTRRTSPYRKGACQSGVPYRSAAPHIRRWEELLCVAHLRPENLRYAEGIELSSRR